MQNQLFRIRIETIPNCPMEVVNSFTFSDVDFKIKTREDEREREGVRGAFLS